MRTAVGAGLAFAGAFLLVLAVRTGDPDDQPPGRPTAARDGVRRDPASTRPQAPDHNRRAAVAAALGALAASAATPADAALVQVPAVLSASQRMALAHPGEAFALRGALATALAGRRDPAEACLTSAGVEEVVKLVCVAEVQTPGAQAGSAQIRKCEPMAGTPALPAAGAACLERALAEPLVLRTVAHAPFLQGFAEDVSLDLELRPASRP